LALVLALCCFMVVIAPLAAQEKPGAEARGSDPGPGPGSPVVRDDTASHTGPIVTKAAVGSARSTSARGGQTVDSLVRVAHSPLRIDWHLLVGSALPTGAFGEQTGRNPGFAVPGLTLGLDYVVGSRFAWVSSVVASMNPSNNSSTHDVVYLSLDLPPTTKVDVGPWYTVWLTTGLQYGYDVSPSVHLQPLLQLGLLIARSSNVDFMIEEDAGSSSVLKFNQASVWASSVCATFGANVMFGDRYLLSARYMFGTPTYDLFITGPRPDFSIHNLYDQPTSVLQVVGGLVF
jgi:hypothetical protein